jgi:hypothetical protein
MIHCSYGLNIYKFTKNKSNLKQIKVISWLVFTVCGKTKLQIQLRQAGWGSIYEQRHSQRYSTGHTHTYDKATSMPGVSHNHGGVVKE